MKPAFWPLFKRALALALVALALAAVLGGINDLHAGTDEDPKPFPVAAVPKAFRYAGEDMGALDNPDLWPQVLAATSVSVDVFGQGHEDVVRRRRDLTRPRGTVRRRPGTPL